MRTRRMSHLAVAVPLSLLTVAVAAVPAAAAALPCQVPQTNRHHVTNINLDADAALERVDVFNVDQAMTPATQLMVCNRVRGQLVRANLKVIWGPGPGYRESGLVNAWVGNLDRTDHRIEVAARNAVTASAGEELVILRQRRSHSLTFEPLQTIAADTVTLQRPKAVPAYVNAFVKATHSVDGKAHTERWTYAAGPGRWRCTTDCKGRP